MLIGTLVRMVNRIDDHNSCRCRDLKICFHRWCKVVKNFSDGDVLIENSYGVIRRAEIATLRKQSG